MRMKDKEEAKRAYDKIAEVYHKKRVQGKDFNELIEKPTSFSFLGNVKGKKLLDAGCGSGIYTKLLEKKGAKVYGLELSSNMLRLAKEYCKGQKIEFKQGNIDNIPYKNNNFDIILSSLVLNYIKNHEKIFKEFNRVLKKNGILVFSIAHPIFDAVKIINKDRNKRLMEISNYFRKNKAYWYLYKSKIKIPSYPLGFEELFDLIYKNGFIVEKLKEASVPENKRNLPRHFSKFIGVPIFIVVRCRKLK